MNTKATCKLEPVVKSEFGFWSGLAIVAVIAAMVWALSTLFSLGPTWEDALFTTAVIFSALILTLRPAWSSRALWRDLAAALAAHLFFLNIVVRVFVANSIKMGGPWRTLAAIVEGILILSILWRRNVSVRH